MQPADLGVMGRVFRMPEQPEDTVAIYEAVSAKEGVFALWITQEEVDVALRAAGKATCVKASSDDRVAVTVWADGNVTLSMGPDEEGKTFHTLFAGGLAGPVIGTTTTYDGPPGVHCQR